MKKLIALFIAMFMMACNNPDTTNTSTDVDKTNMEDTSLPPLIRDTSDTTGLQPVMP